jgi:hypothetical protein
MDDIFSIQPITEICREFNLETDIAFSVYEKAFNRVNDVIHWQITKRGGYP